MNLPTSDRKFGYGQITDVHAFGCLKGPCAAASRSPLASSRLARAIVAAKADSGALLPASSSGRRLPVELPRPPTGVPVNPHWISADFEWLYRIAQWRRYRAGLRTGELSREPHSRQLLLVEVWNIKLGCLMAVSDGVHCNGTRRPQDKGRSARSRLGEVNRLRFLIHRASVQRCRGNIDQRNIGSYLM